MQINLFQKKNKPITTIHNVKGPIKSEMLLTDPKYQIKLKTM